MVAAMTETINPTQPLMSSSSRKLVHSSRAIAKSVMDSPTMMSV